MGEKKHRFAYPSPVDIGYRATPLAPMVLKVAVFNSCPRPTSASPGPESSTCGKVNTTGKFVTCGRHLCLYNLKCVTK